MKQQIELEFLQDLLKELQISSTIIHHPEVCIPSEIDLHLRESLYGFKNYTSVLEKSMNMASDNTLYRFYDEYACSYLFLRYPEKDENYLFIGPYLLEPISNEALQAIADRHQLSSRQIDTIRLYYHELPIVEDENILLAIVNTYAKRLYQSSDNYTIHYEDAPIYDQENPITASFLVEDYGMTSLSLNMIEQSYANEKILIDAVSKGKLNLLTAATSLVLQREDINNQNESLRTHKNNLIILKTLLRKGAEMGGVHPYHIHLLSNQYADKIEHVHSIKESIHLQEEMIRQYCLLVNQHSLSQYSTHVGQTITLVQYDLTADLSLHTIAESLNVNASYLSTLFRKEMGCTLTEFVNQQRIEHALVLLEKTQKNIQEIAQECGIQDVNYFIKLFKKKVGITPNQYRLKK